MRNCQMDAPPGSGSASSPAAAPAENLRERTEVQEEHLPEIFPDTVAVIGTGRSGTTWLAQIIAASGMELIFEPLHSGQVPEAEECKPLPLVARPGDDPPWTPVIARALAGEFRNEWTLRANPGASRRVIKFIRGNLIADWMSRRFRIRPVFIVRNPLSVIASMIEQEWGINPRFVRGAIRRKDLREAYFEPFMDLVEDEPSEIEAYALLWCVQNYPPWRSGLWERIPLVRFEDLVRNPVEEVHRLAEVLDFDVTGGVLEQTHRLSFMASSWAKRPGYDPTRSWREILSKDEARTIRAIVEQFGLERFLE